MGKATLLCSPNVKSGPMGNRCAFDNGFFPTNRYCFTKWPLLYFDLFWKWLVEERSFGGYIAKRLHRTRTTQTTELTVLKIANV